jgi:hypothetical protein
VCQRILLTRPPARVSHLDCLWKRLRTNERTKRPRFARRAGEYVLLLRGIVDSGRLERPAD